MASACEQEQLGLEVRHLETEVTAAQRAVAVSAAGPSGVDLAGIASNLVALQALLASAPTRVGQGQGVEVLEAINSQVLAMGAAFPAAPTLQAAAPAAGAPQAAAGGTAPAAAPAPAPAGPGGGGAFPGGAFRPPSGNPAAAAWEAAGMDD